MTYNGILLIDKPSDITSHDVVSEIRKKLQIKNVGHAGTLDPLASGLLVILLGEATKLSDYLMNGEKSYECEIELGKTTDTLDISGKVLNQNKCDIAMNEVLNASQMLMGEFFWDIPMYSAKKLNGRKLYDLARLKEELDKIPQKKMSFKDVKVINYEAPFVKVQLSCSKGSFIRSWADQLGKKLGIGACMSALRRTASSSYTIKQALPLKDIENASSISRAFIPIEEALSDMPSLEVKDFDLHLVKNGQISQGLEARLRMVNRYFVDSSQNSFKIVNNNKKLLALVYRSNVGRFRFSRVFRS